MGTNFYMKQYLTPEQKQEVVKLINEDKYYEAREILECAKDIHIGKRSSGWKFLWDVHDFRYYKPTKEALMEWLKSGDIIDEYGEHFTFEQFMKEQLGVCYLEDGYDLERYYKENPQFNKCYMGERYVRDFYNTHNVPVDRYGEFYLDDLRCTISEDFS